MGHSQLKLGAAAAAAAARPVSGNRAWLPARLG